MWSCLVSFEQVTSLLGHLGPYVLSRALIYVDISRDKWNKPASSSQPEALSLSPPQLPQPVTISLALKVRKTRALPGTYWFSLAIWGEATESNLIP